MVDGKVQAPAAPALIPALPRLLDMLDLRGRVAAADAIHAQRATAAAGDALAAKRSAWVAVATTVVWGFAVATAMVLLRTHLAGLYSTEAAVVQLAASLLVIGALFQVFDASQVTIMGALRGYKDTRGPMWIAIGAYWALGLPVGATLCFGLLGNAPGGVQGIWWGLVVGLGAAAVALIVRLMRVSNDPQRIGAHRLG